MDTRTVYKLIGYNQDEKVLTRPARYVPDGYMIWDSNSKLVECTAEIWRCKLVRTTELFEGKQLIKGYEISVYTTGGTITNFMSFLKLESFERTVAEDNDVPECPSKGMQYYPMEREWRWV